MSVVDIERRADCAVLTLNRPQVLNTISNDVLDALEQHLAAIPGDDSRALILTGTGRAFCMAIRRNGCCACMRWSSTCWSSRNPSSRR